MVCGMSSIVSLGKSDASQVEVDQVLAVEIDPGEIDGSHLRVRSLALKITG